MNLVYWVLWSTSEIPERVQADTFPELLTVLARLSYSRGTVRWMTHLERKDH